MPFYEYQCRACQADFETFVKTMSSAVPACPECGSRKVTRKLSVFGVGTAAPPPPPTNCASCSHSGSCPANR